MKALLIPAAALAFGQSLATDYTRAERLRVESVTSFTMETTSVSSDFGDGPGGGRRGAGGGMSLSEKRRVVHVDEYVERDEDKPTHVRRTFETVSASSTVRFGDESRDVERESPLDDVTLSLRVDEDGDVRVTVDSGGRVDAEALEGHLPTLALDALLPDGKVDEGATWELDGEAILRALGLDVDAALFPRPERGDAEPREGRGGQGRGGFGRGVGTASPVRLLLAAEWEGSATLESLSDEHRGTECAVIVLEMKGQGSIDEPDFGGRGGRRGRSLAAALPTAPISSDFSIEIEGRLYYSLADRRPIEVELEGKLTLERNIERTTERGTFSMSSTHEGTIHHTVRVSAARSE